MKSDYFWQIILILIGALATTYAGYWFGNQPEDAIVIEYREDINTNLKRLIGDTSEIEILHGGKSLSELSNISYVIANTAKKNLDKFKIYFEILDKDQNPIFHNINPPSDYPREAITLISEKDGVYVFELEYLNRSETIWGGLNFSFYFAGSKPPKISVKTGTKGLAIKEFDYSPLGVTGVLSKLVQSVWFWLFNISYFSLAYLYIMYGKAKRKVKLDEFRKTVEEVIEDENIEADEKSKKISELSTDQPAFRKVVKLIFKKDKA